MTAIARDAKHQQIPESDDEEPDGHYGWPSFGGHCQCSKRNLHTSKRDVSASADVLPLIPVGRFGPDAGNGVTGVRRPVDVPPKLVPYFRPAKELKDLINQQQADVLLPPLSE